MTKRRTSWTCVLLAATLTASLATDGIALGQSKGKPKPPEPSPAIVKYDLQRVPMPADYKFGIPFPRNINDQGEIVGYYDSLVTPYQPYYVDGTGLLTNLNDISLDPLFDMPDPPDGWIFAWYIYAATDINNWGDITGILALPDNTGSTESGLLRGFVLELRPDNGGPPRLHLIPDQEWSRTYPSRINNAGEVLGRGDATTDCYIYRPPLHGLEQDENPSVDVLPFDFEARYAYLNNPVGNSPAQVLTHDGRLYTLGDAAAANLNINARIDGFNDAGLICGSRQVAGKGKQTKEVGYIYDGQFNDISSLHIALNLNENADVIGSGSSGPTLVHADHGVIDLDFAGYVWLVSERGILGTDPAVADFPVIVGTSGGDLLILRPGPVQP